MKTQLTLDMEAAVMKHFSKQGVFVCPEVTIGWFGSERVDFLIYDTERIWRCLELKVSASDFRSRSELTFIGHYNAFVMPQSLYEQLGDELKPYIWDKIGFYVYDEEYKRISSAVRCGKRPLRVDSVVLYESMIRSLTRERDKSDKQLRIGGI